MASIEIDFEVYKALTARRASEKTTYNDVIRELLGLKHPINHDQITSHNGSGDWVTKGVHFPSGTEFQARYKGKIFRGKAESGYLKLEDGTRHSTPSSAAVAITKNFVNGWTFWECRLSGDSHWKIIKSLRNGRGN